MLERVGLFADGVAVSQVGKNNLDVIKCVDEVMTVNIDEVCAAVKDIFEDTRVLSEPSGDCSCCLNTQKELSIKSF